MGIVRISGQPHTYRYNKDGLRNRKYMAYGTVYYQYDGDLLVGEYKLNTSSALVYELGFAYDSAGSVLSMVYNGTEYYYVKNLQEDIVGILDG